MHRYLAATLDGLVNAVDAVYEAKFMLPWSFSEEAAAEKHMAQLQHNMSAAWGQPLDNSGDEPTGDQTQTPESYETHAPETTVVRRRRIAAKTIRLRDKEHRKFVAAQPCVVCGRTPTKKPTTFALPSPVPSTERSATNTPSPSAGSIIASCAGMAMKLRGGRALISTLCPLRSTSGDARAPIGG